MNKLKLILVLCAFYASIADADVIFYPVADGGVYSSGSTSTFGISVANNVHGDLQFSNFNSAAYSTIRLELSAYGLPVYGPVNVYAFDNAAGYLNGGDFNAGTLLGSFSVPNAYGQPGYFDVTAFVHSAKGTYFGFELQPGPGGGAILCSSTMNYGLRPELIATPAAVAASLASVTFTNNRFSFALTGTTGSNYVVQATTNLTVPNWISIQTNTAPFSFVQSNAGLFARRFYRAMVAP